MTEDELFAAVHKYADEIAFVTSNEMGEPAAAVGHPDDHKAAREKLLEAIRWYAVSLPVEIVLPGHARWMRAKSAVCDAYLALDGYTGAFTDPEHELRAKVTAAVAVLRELQEKP